MHTTLLRFAKALDATGNFDFIMFVGVIPRSYNYPKKIKRFKATNI